MNQSADLQALIAHLRASPTGLGLLSSVFLLPTATADPTNQTNAPDGLTIAWSSAGVAYHSTFYAALNDWRTVTLT